MRANGGAFTHVSSNPHNVRPGGHDTKVTCPHVPGVPVVVAVSVVTLVVVVGVVVVFSSVVCLCSGVCGRSVPHFTSGVFSTNN